jgi:hypothetical protein
MNKTTLLRGVCAALFSTAAAVAMAQGSSTGTPTSDAGDRGSKNATGKSSNDADQTRAASGVHGSKDKSKKEKASGKDGSNAPAQGSGNSDRNAPGTNKSTN